MRAANAGAVSASVSCVRWGNAEVPLQRRASRANSRSKPWLLDN